VIKDGAEEKSDGKIHCIADYIEESYWWEWDKDIHSSLLPKKAG